ncbi:MAG: outer membrane protein transport protein, partial [Planctomycetes bacterium]|nr:outer membrane protein transport protein [Planctomycetota bacterium]
MRILRVLACAVVLIAGARFASECRAQSFGVELHNTLMPASGGMAGTSLAMPQDLQSAIYGNPATLTQYQGTQFSVGGAWVEPTYNIEQLTPLPAIGVDPFSSKSGLVGSATPNIGVTQDLSELGLPVTFGIGLFSNAGCGVDFRDVPESNGTSADYMALDIVFAAGMDLTDRLSLGAAFTLGNSYLDGPFVDLGGMTPAYGIRGTVGLNYD